MRKPHRKRLLAWLLTTALLLTTFPISVLSEEAVENPIQTEIVEQDEPETVEEPNLSDFPTEETGEPSGTMEIPADENTPDIPDQDKLGNARTVRFGYRGNPFSRSPGRNA